MMMIHIQHLLALILKNSVVLIIFFFLFSCNTKRENTDSVDSSEYGIIKNYFKEKQNYTLSQNVKTLFVLTDIGCMPCNKHFAELITNNLNDSTSLFLILASGTNMDISQFKKMKSRVFYDKVKNVKNNLLNESRAIFIKKNKVDTIITIDARQIELQFKEIEERLFNNLKLEY